MKLASNNERKWECAAPECKVMFSSTHDPDDKFFCKKHLAEKHNLRNKVRYHTKKLNSKYYRRKRAEALKRNLSNAEKAEKDLYRLLQFNRGKMEIMINELERLEDLGVRISKV